MQPPTEPPSDTSTTPMPPASPAVRLSSVGEMPVAPPRPRNPRNLIVGIAAAVALVAIFATVLIVRAKIAEGSDATTLLNRANLANLHDTSFTINGTVSLTAGGVSASTKVTGDGALIRQPFRMHTNIQIGSIAGLTDAINAELIIDGNDLYLKLAGNSMWQKISGATSQLPPGVILSDVLDYQKLKNPRTVGEDTINGRKAWHITANLADQLLSGSNAATATVVVQQTHTTITGTEDLWIFQDSLFPAKLTLHEISSSSAQTLGSLNTDVTQTLNFTAWNSGVVINLPPPNQVQG